MSGEEALALVRHAFRRDVWREINQRQLINDRHGPGRNYDHTRNRVDRGMLDPKHYDPVFFDISEVRRPADPIAFHTYQALGAAIGHTAGLERVEL